MHLKSPTIATLFFFPTKVYLQSSSEVILQYASCSRYHSQHFSWLVLFVSQGVLASGEHSTHVRMCWQAFQSYRVTMPHHHDKPWSNETRRCITGFHSSVNSPTTTIPLIFVMSWGQRHNWTCCGQYPSCQHAMWSTVLWSLSQSDVSLSHISLLTVQIKQHQIDC